MTADQFRTAINKLGLSPLAAARLLGVDDRTSRQWANGEHDIPAPAVRFLQYLIATGKTGEEAMKILDSWVLTR
jgi:DNA-binding transcriptional regulator YiaG